jgi:hypothetical protein
MEITPECFSGVPEEILKKLKNAASEAKMVEVEALIEKIRKTHPNLAQWLADMAYDFEYGKIATMIEDLKSAD